MASSDLCSETIYKSRSDNFKFKAPVQNDTNIDKSLFTSHMLSNVDKISKLTTYRTSLSKLNSKPKHEMVNENYNLRSLRLVKSYRYPNFIDMNVPRMLNDGCLFDINKNNNTKVIPILSELSKYSNSISMGQKLDILGTLKQLSKTKNYHSSINQWAFKRRGSNADSIISGRTLFDSMPVRYSSKRDKSTWGTTSEDSPITDRSSSKSNKRNNYLSSTPTDFLADKSFLSSTSQLYDNPISIEFKIQELESDLKSLKVQNQRLMRSNSYSSESSDSAIQHDNLNAYENDDYIAINNRSLEMKVVQLKRKVDIYKKIIKKFSQSAQFSSAFDESQRLLVEKHRISKISDADLRELDISSSSDVDSITSSTHELTMENLRLQETLGMLNNESTKDLDDLDKNRFQINIQIEK